MIWCGENVYDRHGRGCGWRMIQAGGRRDSRRGCVAWLQAGVMGLSVKA